MTEVIVTRRGVDSGVAVKVVIGRTYLDADFHLVEAEPYQRFAEPCLLLTEEEAGRLMSRLIRCGVKPIHPDPFDKFEVLCFGADMDAGAKEFASLDAALVYLDEQRAVGVLCEIV
jgi:hypothetical protein